MTAKKLKFTPEEKLIFEGENKIQKKPKIIIKPIKKDTPIEKEIKKIVKDIKKSEPEKVKPVIERDKRNIVIDIYTTTKYRINYSYIRRKITFPFIIAYKRYEIWFNKKFNTPKLSKEDILLKKELLECLNSDKELPKEWQDTNIELPKTIIIHQKKKPEMPDIYRSDK